MNYLKIYHKIVKYRTNHIHDSCTESHYIVPLCVGGSNDKSNQVMLTEKEHYICLRLLTKIYKPGTLEHYKLSYDFLNILMKKRDVLGNKCITVARYDANILYMRPTQTGVNNSQYNTFWIYNDITFASRKIKVGHEIPDGWSIGRKMYPPRPRLCVSCGNKFSHSTSKYCSKECWPERDRKPHLLDGREQEFLDYYSCYRSINRSLKKMGYRGAGAYYTWAKNVLKDVRKNG